MPFKDIKADYSFESEGDYLLIKTDFERIKINTESESSPRFCLEERNLLRFLNGELVEEYFSKDKIHPVFFLPSHKETEFFSSLEKEEIHPEFMTFYTEDMLSEFKNIQSYIRTVESTISHKDRSDVCTSFYGVEECSLEDLVSAAYQILELNSMRDYKISLGEINKPLGLLERSKKVKTKSPKSRHYNFWKFCESYKGVSFEDVANNFRVI